MLYREAGDFKTTYAKDQQTFPIAFDRWGSCCGPARQPDHVSTNPWMDQRARGLDSIARRGRARDRCAGPEGRDQRRAHRSNTGKSVLGVEAE